MNRKKVYLILITIFILTVAAAVLSFPNYFNKGIDSINAKFHWGLPRFAQIPFKLGLDLQGGTHLVYEADLSNIEESDRSSAMAGLRDIIERRVNLFGVQEPIVQTQKTGEHYRLIVELAGIKDPAEAIKMIGQTPYLEFREERPEEETKRILEKREEIKGKSVDEIKKTKDWQVALEDPYFKPTPLTGKYLKEARLSFDPNTGEPIILLHYNNEGAKILKDLTKKNIGKILAIYIDGQPISTPRIQEEIPDGSAQITGSFTIEEAKKLVRDLNAGALPVPIKLISQQSVGPVLGSISLAKSLKAGIWGLIAVVLFMIFFYRLPGILASLSLGIYVLFVLALFKILGVTLSLAGIGGFILSIGMAVDANVLIFSRMKEEMSEKEDFGAALEEGFRRSWPSIRDGNATTLIIAFILFWFGTSFIKGFAFTLSIGIIVSVFSAVFIVRNLLRLFIGTRLEKWKWLWKPLF
ncbi:MAG TPA: protein translocase subunit SecD [Candidatus Parcubacteria bacterium]|nr:protein translocase subunit SecD [Candidatus Parcubacteria bacterium]